MVVFNSSVKLPEGILYIYIYPYVPKDESDESPTEGIPKHRTLVSLSQEKPVMLVNYAQKQH